MLHLGNGASASAIVGGRPVDTSMGLTPMEGLVMGTRSGDIDPGVIMYLWRTAKMSLEDIESMLNRRSGVLGLGGEIDFRVLHKLIESGDTAAQLAYDVYIHRLRKYIGAYLALLGNADVITFTAGVGENDAAVRRDALSGMAALGIELDEHLNESPGQGRPPHLGRPVADDRAGHPDQRGAGHRPRLRAGDLVPVESAFLAPSVRRLRCFARFSGASAQCPRWLHFRLDPPGDNSPHTIQAVGAVGHCRSMGNWGEPFIGSEALAAGTVNWHQLRTRYCALFPNVYAQRLARPSLQQRIVAAWLWSHRQATIAGLAAAALHGSKWIDADTPVELVHANARPPKGIITRRDALLDDEVVILDGRAVTTPERTAVDIGRRGSILSAVARLDALANATGFKIDDVARVASRHRGARGLRHLETVLELVDGGAQSPKESQVRLWLIEAGFPRPQTQIPVFGPDGVPFAFLDLGWEEWMLGVEYDGEHHFGSRFQIASDIHRLEKVEQLWRVVRVTAEDRRSGVIRRVHRAVEAQGFECPCNLPSGR